MQLEIIVTNLAEAILAEKYQADRLELIHDFSMGGLSPDLLLSQAICSQVNIPVHVMLRPHANGFYHNNNQQKIILRELEYLRDHTQAHGIVFGALDHNNTNLDLNFLEQIIALKGHLKITFHRAIDVTYNPLDSYKELLNYRQIDLVLTSGGKDNALQGAKTIKKMVTLNNNQAHCQVLAGSGITTDNIQQVIDQANPQQIHIGSGVRSQGTLDRNKFNLIKSIIKSPKSHPN